MGMQEGRPDWRRVSRDFLKIFLKSRTNRRGLSAVSPFPLIANKDTPLSGPFTGRYPIAREAVINKEFLFAIRGLNEGLPDWWRMARDFLKIFRKSLTNQSLGIIGPSS